MKLYYSPGACSLSPHIVLQETGLPFEAVLASTKTHQLADGTDYYGINPKGYVPLLELDDGQRLWLVDWEYGGRGNPLFDLASFLALADLGPVPTEVFLDAYGWPRSRDGGLLEDARWLFDYVQWLWYRSRFPHPVGDEAWYAERLAQRLLRCNN